MLSIAGQTAGPNEGTYKKSIFFHKSNFFSSSIQQVVCKTHKYNTKPRGCTCNTTK